VAPGHNHGLESGFSGGDVKKIQQGLVAGSLVALAVAAGAQTAPKVEAAWARPTVQGQAGGGAFLRITGGATADRLLSASAGVAREVELHTMEMEGNVMRMRPIDGIDVPAGKTIELKPGGQHVMFVGLTQTLKSGAHFPMTLRFEKAGAVKVEVQVMLKAPGGPAEVAHEHQHQHKP
jgi:copper(I)-binding protein